MACKKNTALPSRTVSAMDVANATPMAGVVTGMHIMLYYTLKLNTKLTELLEANCLDVESANSVTEGTVVYLTGSYDPKEFDANIGLACPFVYTFDKDRDEWIFDTTILYKIVGKAEETYQSRELTRFDGRLLLCEMEPETTSIDQITVVVRDAEGHEHSLIPDFGPVQFANGSHYVMSMGDKLILTFEGFDRIQDPQSCTVVAKGYYEPYPAGHGIVPKFERVLQV